MSNPFRLANRVTRLFINRATRRQRENAAGSDSDSARKLSSGAPLIFETLEPRLLLAADPLGITAGYAFDEVSGTSAADASGHGIVGTLTNGPTFTAGKYGNAVTLDGTNDFVNLGNPTALQFTGSMTISAWINSSSFPVDDAAIVSKRTGSESGFQLDTTVDTGSSHDRVQAHQQLWRRRCSAMARPRCSPIPGITSQASTMLRLRP